MTFAEFVRLSRAYKWILIGAAIAGVLVMVALTTRQPTLYAATSSGIVKVGSSSSVGEEMSNLQLADEKINLYTTLIGTTPVAERIVQELKLDLAPGDVAGRLSAEGGRANTIVVRAVASSPIEARDLAGAAMDAVAAEVAEIESIGRPERRRDLELVRIVPLEQAQLPQEPFAPDYRMAAMQGGAGGLVLAYAFLIARKMIDRRVRSVKDVEEATGASVIGITRRSRTWLVTTAASRATWVMRPRRSDSCAPTCASSTSTTSHARSSSPVPWLARASRRCRPTWPDWSRMQGSRSCWSTPTCAAPRWPRPSGSTPRSV